MVYQVDGNAECASRGCCILLIHLELYVVEGVDLHQNPASCQF